MAIGIHVARVAFVNVDNSGNVLSKDDQSVTLKQQMQTQMQHRVLVDASIPNTAARPTVDAYLKLEASDDFVLEYMDQNTIITYARTSSGGFA